MKILVVCSTNLAAREAAQAHGLNVEVRSPTLEVRQGDTSVFFRALNDWGDVHALRGQPFDLIVEHYSFNPHRNMDVDLMLTDVKAWGLR